MRILAVVNPVSGRGSTKAIWPRLDDEMRKRAVDYSTIWTEKPGHAVEIARKAKKDGFSRIISVGGDGTLREIVEGTAGSDIEVAVIPSGSGNDFSRAIGVPRDPYAALDLALDGTLEDVNVGEMDGRVFINVAGCGIDAEVANMANEDLRIIPGKLAYLIGALSQLMIYKPRVFDVNIDGNIQKIHAYMVVVANGRFLGGGMMIAPDADLTDNLFDIYIIGAMGRFALLKCLTKVYSGSHTNEVGVWFTRGRNVHVDANHAVRCQIDGEVIGRTPIAFRISDRKVRMVAALDKGETVRRAAACGRV